MFLAVDIAFIHGEMWVRGLRMGDLSCFPEDICRGRGGVTLILIEAQVLRLYKLTP